MPAKGSSSTASRATSRRRRRSTRCSTRSAARSTSIFFFDLDDETAKKRALGRAHEEGRTDDTPESIARRLSLYHEQTEPVVEYYRATGKLVPLHASRSVEEVANEIQSALATVGAR